MIEYCWSFLAKQYLFKCFLNCILFFVHSNKTSNVSANIFKLYSQVIIRFDPGRNTCKLHRVLFSGKDGCFLWSNGIYSKRTCTLHGEILDDRTHLYE